MPRAIVIDYQLSPAYRWVAIDYSGVMRAFTQEPVANPNTAIWEIEAGMETVVTTLPQRQDDWVTAKWPLTEQLILRQDVN